MPLGRRGCRCRPGQGWFVEVGGVFGSASGELGKRYLSVVEWEEISLGLVRGGGVRAIARRVGRVGRVVSTVSRVIIRNGGWRGCGAQVADAAARVWAQRPKMVELARQGELREWVAWRL